MGTLPEQNPIFESGGHGVATNREQYKRLEWPYAKAGKTEDHAAAASASIPQKTDMAAGASAPAREYVCAANIVREILGANSGASISNVLVVGTEGPTLLKRMEIRFGDSEQVPTFFKSLAATLQSSGFQVYAAQNSGIPATEIWLTCSLGDWKKTSLSWSGVVREQVSAGVIVQTGASPDQHSNSSAQLLLP